MPHISNLQFPSDTELLAGCRAGNLQTWQQLVDKYERLVYSIPLNYGLSVEDAADIAQIALTALVNSLDTLRDDSNLGGWLATVARRHTWRLVEQRKRERLNAMEENEEVLKFPDRTNEIERWELIEWLNAGLNLVGERCRNLLTALYFEESEPTYAELAERFNMAEGSIGPTRARCLKRLREMMEI
ncbi:sigma-70 family RNA polymerase sigma factor [Chloroflexi bacterium TSY]|nr:sigma-70 family RNA polymerase sigma factor [Chloroflexi bacterium TSY]